MPQTVRRMGSILDSFSTDRAVLTVSEIVAATGISRSQASSLMASMSEIGLLESRGRGRYAVGGRIAELSDTLAGTAGILAAARPMIGALSRLTGETVHLVVPDRGGVLCVDEVVGSRPVRVEGAGIGSMIPGHSSAVGKALAPGPTDVAGRNAGRPLQQFTGATITDPTMLERELLRVRAEGVAYDRGELITDVRCIAAVVRGCHGDAVAAIGLAVPATRFTRDRGELARAVVASAAELSRRLGEQRTAHRLDTADGGDR